MTRGGRTYHTHFAVMYLQMVSRIMNVEIRCPELATQLYARADDRRSGILLVASFFCLIGYVFYGSRLLMLFNLNFQLLHEYRTLAAIKDPSYEHRFLPCDAQMLNERIKDQ